MATAYSVCTIFRLEQCGALQRVVGALFSIECDGYRGRLFNHLILLENTIDLASRLVAACL